MALFFGAWCDGGLEWLADGAWEDGRMGLFLWTSSDFLGEITIWSGSILGQDPTI